MSWLDQDLIVFDGHCVLCSGLFQQVLRLDRAQHFKFATAQSPLGQRIYADLGLNGAELDTMVVVMRGCVFLRLDAVAAVAGWLPAPWSWGAILRYLPGWIKNPAYAVVARNRYRLWGRAAQCFVPSPEIRSRFAKGGYLSSAPPV